LTAKSTRVQLSVGLTVFTQGGRMATLTGNLFRGRGPGRDVLDVVEGHWPNDMDGSIFIVGPDNRAPGGHWFAEPGMVCRIDCRPDVGGRVQVRSERVRTPLLRLRERLPWLFRTVAFAEVSPFGMTNMANTNVDGIEGRLFIGYDAGRPIEIDPDTLDYLTPVGGNDEWFQALPGLFEPMVAVAAHPAADPEDRAIYFVNYSPVPSEGGSPTVLVARWDLDGAVSSWPLSGMPLFDTIHDVKSSSGHLVFADLPFATGPETFSGSPRTTPNQDITRLFIVSKEAMRTTPVGEPVPVTALEVPLPTGHLNVDVEEADGLLTVHLEHIPLADLMVMLRAGEPAHSGAPISLDHEGLVTLGVQPAAVGRYRIDPRSGAVVESDVIWDDRVWGGILATRDRSSAEARARQRHLWYASLGFDPDLVPEEWWRLYGEAGLDCLVPPGELPTTALPATLSRFDLDAGKVAEVHMFPAGEFPSPPQFVPRAGSGEPDDGYVVVMVHRDGPKELQVFDAQHLERGPLARASAPGFCPPLLLHSTWMSPDRPGRPAYRVPLWRDVWGALRAIPGHVRSLVRTGRSMRAAMAD
jgi:all-trans-8'-apo-beta-carotenal 15,15'-oxygenase